MKASTLWYLIKLICEFEPNIAKMIKELVYEALVTITFNEYSSELFELPESKYNLYIYPSKFYGVFDDEQKAITRKETITSYKSQMIVTDNFGNNRIGIQYKCDIDILIKYIDDKKYYIVYRTQEYGHIMSYVCEIEYDDIIIFRTNSSDDTADIYKINKYYEKIIPEY